MRPLIWNPGYEIYIDSSVNHIYPSETQKRQGAETDMVQSPLAIKWHSLYLNSLNNLNEPVVDSSGSFAVYAYWEQCNGVGSSTNIICSGKKQFNTCCRWLEMIHLAWKSCPVPGWVFCICRGSRCWFSGCIHLVALDVAPFSNFPFFRYCLSLHKLCIIHW